MLTKKEKELCLKGLYLLKSENKLEYKDIRKLDSLLDRFKGLISELDDSDYTGDIHTEHYRKH